MTRRDYENRMRERDMRMGRRDGRNPYGSRGGYVVSDRARRSRRDYGYDMEMGSGYGDSEYRDRRDYGYDSRYDYAGYDRNYESDGEYDRNYRMYPPYMRSSDFARRRSSTTGRYMRDRASQGEKYLSEEELMEWAKDLMRDVEEKDKPYFSRENMQRKAQEMGIRFDDFSFSELYVTTLMMYTDYKDTLGTANMDLYIRLAKDWLCDEDSELQYGEKLAAYYDSVIASM